MPLFQYRALSPSGQVIEGTIAANNRPEAVNQLKTQGIKLLNVSEQSADTTIKPVAVRSKSKRSRITRNDIQVFTSQLAALLRAGIVLSQALLILEEQTESESLGEIIKNIRSDIQGGSSLSDALNKYPKHFSTMYCSMIRVGESGGVLDSVLKQLSSFMEAEHALRSNIMTAMAYPLLVVLVGIGSILVLITFVIPRLSSVFADFGDRLPLPTKILLATSDFFLSYWWLVVLAFIGLYYGAKKAWDNPQGKVLITQWIDKIPAFGPMMIKAQIARFSRTMATLVKSGIPILSALNLVIDTSSSPILRQCLQQVSDKVKKGEGLANPLKETGFFPPMVTNLIAVGEESGTLDEMLYQVADTYDQEVQHAIKRFITLFEPLVIILLAIGVGGVLMAFLLPILNIGKMVS